MRAAVIGAGIAGLNLARRLSEMGLDVKIFEKARGPSGRISTRRTDEGQFDHGAQYLTARDPIFRAQVEDWQARGIVARWDSRIVRLNAGKLIPETSQVERFVGCPRMSAIARDLAGDCEMEVGLRIENARRVGEKWILESDAGFEYADFDWLMVAVPATQAVPLLRSAPLLAAEAGAVRMLPCHAVMVTFVEDVGADFDGAFIESNDSEAALSWVARNSSKPGRAPEPCWVLHSDPAWSHARVDLDPQEVSRLLLEHFEEALGRPLPGVAFSATHRWLLARPEAPLTGRPLWDSSARIGVCGDWLMGDRVEDAYLSAERLAETLGAALGVG